MYGNYSMLDYNIKANAFYHYLVAYRQSSGSYKMYEDTIVNLDGTTSPAYISTKWDFWTICDIEETETEKLYVKTGNIWKLRYNMDNGELTQNNSISTFHRQYFLKKSVNKKITNFLRMLVVVIGELFLLLYQKALSSWTL